MTTYKLVRIKAGKFYPLFVECDRELPMGEWLEAGVGKPEGENSVTSRIGPLSLRPGWHSCTVPFANWIGKRGKDGRLYQRPDTAWAECVVEGKLVEVKGRRGLRTIPEGWYFFRTNPLQPFPWIISNRIRIIRILPQSEVEKLCRKAGMEAQPVWGE